MSVTSSIVRVLGDEMVDNGDVMRHIIIDGLLGMRGLNGGGGDNDRR